MCGYQTGMEQWDELGDWDWHIYTIDTRYKIDNYWEPTIQHKEPYPMLCGDLHRKEIQGKGGIYMLCMVDSLCYMADSNTAL